MKIYKSIRERVVSLRICHMIPGFFPIAKGGAEIFALNLCINLIKKGNEVYLITRNLNFPCEETIEGVLVRRFSNILPYKIKYYGFGEFVRSKYIRILVALFDLIGAIPTLLNLHRKKQLEVLHASFILPFGLLGVIIRKLLKIPLVITVHGPADFYEVPHFFDPILRFVLKKADKVIVVSPKLKKDILRRLGKLSLKLICNGVSLDPYMDFGNVIQTSLYGISSKDFIILTAGRLVKRKNLHLLIQAMPKILEKIPTCKIILLGRGIEKGHLKNLIEKLQLTTKIIMPGWIAEERKVELFKRADIFIQLSQVEGLSLAFLESKAAGIPAVVVKTEDRQRKVNSDKNAGGLIDPPITIEKIVDNIIYLYQNFEVRQKMRIDVRSEAEKLYSLEKMVENYNQVFQNFTKRRGIL